jgi:hypothetical protein
MIFSILRIEFRLQDKSHFMNAEMANGKRVKLEQ